MKSTDSGLSQTNESTIGKKKGRPCKSQPSCEKKSSLTKMEILFLGATILEAASLVTTRDGTIAPASFDNFYKDLEKIYPKYLGE